MVRNLSEIMIQQAKIDQPSSLLSLCPELRNRTYEYTATACFSQPPAAFYIPENARDEEVDASLPPAAMAAMYAELETTGGVLGQRFALISTCRQLYHESNRILYTNASISLSHILLRSSLWKLKSINDSFTEKLQCVAHIELDYSTAMTFLFAPAYKQDWIQSDQEVWRHKYNTSTSTCKELLKCRALLFGLKSATVYPDQKYSNTYLEAVHGSVGSDIQLHLTEKVSRDTLHRIFPKLTDIATMNNKGSERFRKTETGQWQLAYTRELLPLELRDNYYEFADPEMFNSYTGLSVSTTISCLGVVHNQVALKSTVLVSENFREWAEYEVDSSTYVVVINS